MIKVKIVKEVKRSDGLWRFACGDVFHFTWLRDDSLFLLTCLYSIVLCLETEQMSFQGSWFCSLCVELEWTAYCRWALIRPRVVRGAAASTAGSRPRIVPELGNPRREGSKLTSVSPRTQVCRFKRKLSVSTPLSLILKFRLDLTTYFW